MEKVIYADFENYKTEKDLTNMINRRITELEMQGYCNEQILQIIFENSGFKNKFLNENDYFRIKKEHEDMIMN